MNSTNLLQNRQNAAAGCSGTFKMEAFGTQNATLEQQNEPLGLQIETPERPDGPSECQNGCPAGPWWPHLLLFMLLTAVFDAPGNLREWFWTAPVSYFGEFDVHRTANLPASGLQSASAGCATRKQYAGVPPSVVKRRSSSKDSIL